MKYWACILLLALTLTSCGSLLPTLAESPSRKEMRKCDRAARKLERQIDRATKRCPSMARAIRDTQIVAVKVPSISGTILAMPAPPLAALRDRPFDYPQAPKLPLQVRPGTPPALSPTPSHALRALPIGCDEGPKTFYFSDSILTARITFEQFMEIMNAPPPQLEYEVHARDMNLPALVDTTTIDPIQREPYPLAWWQIALMTVGAITILYLLIRIPVKILP